MKGQKRTLFLIFNLKKKRRSFLVFDGGTGGGCCCCCSGGLATWGSAGLLGSSVWTSKRVSVSIHRGCSAPNSNPRPIGLKIKKIMIIMKKKQEEEEEFQCLFCLLRLFLLDIGS